MKEMAIDCSKKDSKVTFYQNALRLEIITKSKLMSVKSQEKGRRLFILFC